MRNVVLELIALYKNLLSPLVGGRCRFYPSCSNYASSAFERHKPLRALGLSIKRLLRCHPWNPGGVDLVP